MKLLYKSLFLCFFFLTSFLADAQQIAGGEITYTCGGNDNYTVKVVLYAKCPNPNLPSSIKLNIFSPAVSIPPAVNMTSTGSDETIKACINKPSSCEVASGEKTDAIIKRTYTATIKLPSKQTNWRLSIQESNTRTNLSTIVDVNNAPLNLKAEINNNICNSSSTFDNNPLFFSASKTAVTYDPGIKNLDGDNIKIALIQPMRTNDTPLAYKSGFSVTNPVSGTPVTINQNNGVLTFTPSMPQETSTMAIQVRETRGTTFAGSVMREMYFQTLPEQTSPPAFASPLSDTINICASSGPVSISISGTSAAGTVLDIILNNPNEWRNASLNIVKGNGSATLNLTASLSTGIKPLNVTLANDKCGIVTKTFYVKVNPKPVITNPVRPDSVVICHKNFKINIKPSGGKAPYKYLWSTGQTTDTLTVKSPTTHSVTVTDANNCTSDPWFKRISSPINFEVGEITCVDSLLRFYDVSKGITTSPVSSANPLDSTTQTWTLTKDSTVMGTGPYITYKFPGAGTYEVKMTISGKKGCNNSLPKTITVHGKPKADFSFTDKCVETERSDLKLKENINDGGSPVKRVNIDYFVDHKPRPYVVEIPNILLLEKDHGLHKVKLQVKNDAGCVDTISKTVVVNPKPLITQSTKKEYYYRCDSPGFPDTTFIFKATPAGLALTQPFNITVERRPMPDIQNSAYVPNTSITVPYTVRQNSVNLIELKTEDGQGCTNDTTVNILDPVTPKISLTKYYCFLNDTLKLKDLSYSPSQYKWGLKTSFWDMKDGQTQNTFGFANHAYSTLEEAKVSLKVTDVTGCSDTTSIQVYLSEPDTSQFQIIKPLACVNEEVKILGIKNNYINAWYYRYADTITSIYDTPDKVVVNPQSEYGKSFPLNLDDIKKFPSSKYNASTVIFYNEKDASKDLITLFNPMRKIPSNVCHIQVTRAWRVLERQPFKINDTYDHCYDSLKIFDASLLAPLAPFTTIDTSSWKWSLYAPGQSMPLNEVQLTKNSEVIYKPATSLFTIVATERQTYKNNNNKYPPYKIKSSYLYTYKFGKDSLTCSENTEREVANEKVAIELDLAKTTCANYFFPVPYNSAEFIERFTINSVEIDERKDFTWRYGDSIFVEYPFSQKFSQPGRYDLIGSVKNYYGCEGSDTMIVLVRPSPVAKLTTDTVCYGVNNTLNGDRSIAASPDSKITNYYWFYSPTIPISAPNTPDISLAAKVTKTSSYKEKFEVGTYPVGLAVVDSNGCCALSDIRYAKVNDLPGIDFNAIAKNTQDQDYLGNEPIEFIPVSTPNVFYSKWNMGDGKILESNVNNYQIEYTYPYYSPPFPKEKNMYDITLLVRTIEGCVDSVTKKLDVNAYFELPNAFSPNEDGLHDILLGVGKGIKEIKEFKIFNRWGEVIHTVSGVPEKDALRRGYLLWDGVYNGQVQPVGAYVYYAVVKTGYGNDLIKKGNLTLLK